MKNRKIFIYILIAILCWKIIAFGYSILPSIKVATNITPAQAEAIQKEFGFVLPKDTSIVLCRFANSRDSLFSVVITGPIDEKDFIMNNLEFEVGELSISDHESYDATKKNDHYYSDEWIKADYYYGFLDGSQRKLYFYNTDFERILEIQKGGITSRKLLNMFGMTFW